MSESPPNPPHQAPRWWLPPAITGGIAILLFLAATVVQDWRAAQPAGTPMIPNVLPWIEGAAFVAVATGWVWNAYVASQWRAANAAISGWNEYLRRFREHANGGGFTVARLDETLVSKANWKARVRVRIDTQSPFPLRYGPMIAKHIGIHEPMGKVLLERAGHLTYVGKFVAGGEAPPELFAELVCDVPATQAYPLFVVVRDITIALCDENGRPLGRNMPIKDIPPTMVSVTSDEIRVKT